MLLAASKRHLHSLPSFMSFVVTPFRLLDQNQGKLGLKGTFRGKGLFF
jgi:hypothetical protein